MTQKITIQKVEDSLKKRSPRWKCYKPPKKEVFTSGVSKHIEAYSLPTPFFYKFMQRVERGCPRKASSALSWGSWSAAGACFAFCSPSWKNRPASVSGKKTATARQTIILFPQHSKALGGKSSTQSLPAPCLLAGTEALTQWDVGWEQGHRCDICMDLTGMPKTTAQPQRLGIQQFTEL